MRYDQSELDIIVYHVAPTDCLKLVCNYMIQAFLVYWVNYELKVM